MKTGTVGQDVKKEREGERHAAAGQTDGSPGGRGGDGNDGDDFNDDFLAEDTPSGSITQVLSWFVLVVVLMTFGGLIGAYILISTNNVLEWKPFELPIQVWFSTVLILASSVTYKIAQKALLREDQTKARNWFVATTVFGAAFISSQILLWLALINRGVYLQSNPYAGFFYLMTALHALHVAGGIVALGTILLRVWNYTRSDEELKRRKELSTAVGWYWHFMDGLWIVLVLLLGFWK